MDDPLIHPDGEGVQVLDCEIVAYLSTQCHPDLQHNPHCPIQLLHPLA